MSFLLNQLPEDVYESEEDEENVVTNRHRILNREQIVNFLSATRTREFLVDALLSCFYEFAQENNFKYGVTNFQKGDIALLLIYQFLKGLGFNELCTDAGVPVRTYRRLFFKFLKSVTVSTWIELFLYVSDIRERSLYSATANNGITDQTTLQADGKCIQYYRRYFDMFHTEDDFLKFLKTRKRNIRGGCLNAQLVCSVIGFWEAYSGVKHGSINDCKQILDVPWEKFLTEVDQIGMDKGYIAVEMKIIHKLRKMEEDIRKIQERNKKRRKLKRTLLRVPRINYANFAVAIKKKNYSLAERTLNKEQKKDGSKLIERKNGLLERRVPILGKLLVREQNALFYQDKVLGLGLIIDNLCEYYRRKLKIGRDRFIPERLQRRVDRRIKRRFFFWKEKNFNIKKPKEEEEEEEEDYDPYYDDMKTYNMSKEELTQAYEDEKDEVRNSVFAAAKNRARIKLLQDQLFRELENPANKDDRVVRNLKKYRFIVRSPEEDSLLKILPTPVKDDIEKRAKESIEASKFSTENYFGNYSQSSESENENEEENNESVGFNELRNRMNEDIQNFDREREKETRRHEKEMEYDRKRRADQRKKKEQQKQEVMKKKKEKRRKKKRKKKRRKKKHKSGRASQGQQPSTPKNQISKRLEYPVDNNVRRKKEGGPKINPPLTQPRRPNPNIPSKTSILRPPIPSPRKRPGDSVLSNIADRSFFSNGKPENIVVATGRTWVFFYHRTGKGTETNQKGEEGYHIRPLMFGFLKGNKACGEMVFGRKVPENYVLVEVQYCNEIFKNIAIPFDCVDPRVKSLLRYGKVISEGVKIVPVGHEKTKCVSSLKALNIIHRCIRDGKLIFLRTKKIEEPPKNTSRRNNEQQKKRGQKRNFSKEGSSQSAIPKSPPKKKSKKDHVVE